MTASPVATTTVTAGSVTLRDLERAGGPIAVVLSEKTVEAVERGHAFVERCLAEGRPVYGATTGFGPLVTYAGRDSAAEQCDNVLQHLTVGQGPDLPPGVARAAVLVRLSSLSRGLSGISLRTLDALRAMLATSFAPAIPTYGSVGASGDLVPFAHVVQALRGVGHAYAGDDRLDAGDALARAGLRPLDLDGRDALALVNGTSLTTAAAGLAAASLRRSHEVAALLTSVLADLLGAAPTWLSPSLVAAFGHPEAEWIGARMAAQLAGAEPSGTRPLQEPYSIRCTPQLLGAAGSALDWSTSVVERDLGAVSDNPLFFADEDLVAHGGNFFGQPAAFGSDLMSIVATQLGNLAERQLDLLVDPHRNADRPAMLAVDPGRQHALQGAQLMATSVVVAMRRACVPAGMQSVPTNLHNQDVVPFGTQGALTAYDQARRLRLLHGALAVAVRQAAHVGRAPTAPRCREVVDAIAARVAPVEQDRALAQDVRTAADVLDELVDAELRPTGV